MRAVKPELVSKRFYARGIHSTDFSSNMAINLCPAFNKSLKNLYAIRSIYDYSFSVETDRCISKLYDQEFFNKHVVIRSMEQRFFSFMNQYLFFTDEKSLEITAQIYPAYEENVITERCMPVSGSFDIGKWFRPLEFPFILKKEFDTFMVNDQDVMYYIKFHTDRPITFKQFFVSDLLAQFSGAVVSTTKGKTQQRHRLDNFYGLFKSKNLVLKEITQNLF